MALRSFTQQFVKQSLELNQDQSDFQNTYVNCLQVTASIVYRFSKLIQVQIVKFNQNLKQLQENLNTNELFGPNSFKPLEVDCEEATKLADCLIQTYLDNERTYFDNRLNLLLPTESPGDEFFQLFKHCTSRINELDCDQTKVNKFECQQKLAVVFSDFLTANIDVFQQNINTIFTIQQKVSLLHNLTNTDSLFELYSSRLD